MNTGNGQKYIAIYEHEIAAVQETPAYRDVLKTDWACKIQTLPCNFNREIYEPFL
jgi:hypothetical protein